MKNLAETIKYYHLSRKALPAFNIDSFEIYQAAEAAVIQTRLPCIVQLSEGEDSFIQAERLLLLVKKAQADGLPIFMNMDHGKNLDRLLHLVSLGIDMIHFDGSALDYTLKLDTARQLISLVKKINPLVLVETEFNRIRPSGTIVSPDSYTDPSQATEFILTTEADFLAISVGNLHGVNLSLPEVLDINRLTQLNQSIPTTYLTLHGGSGIAPAQIQQAINLGIVKININTDLRLKFKHSLADHLSAISSEKIYDYLNPLVSDLKEVMVQKIIQYAN